MEYYTYTIDGQAERGTMYRLTIRTFSSNHTCIKVDNFTYKTLPDVFDRIREIEQAQIALKDFMGVAQ